MAEDIDEIKTLVSDLGTKIDAKYVPRELYDAHRTSLKSEIALELAAIKAQQESDRKVVDSARGLSMWALGLIASAVVVALVGFLLAGAGGPS